MTPPVTKAAPRAEQRPSRSVHHGITREDAYAWLRADNWQEVMRAPDRLDPAIRAHLEAENAYQRAVLAGTEALQKTLVAEMRGRIKEDDSSVPMKDGPFRYGVRFREGGEQPVHIRVPADGSSGGGEPQVLLDGDAEAKGHDYFRLGGVSHSPDHAMIAWAADTSGSEYFTVRLRDLATGRDSDTTIPDTAGGGSFTADSRHLLYTRLDDNHRPCRLYLHAIGGTGEDRLVFHETDPGQFLGAGKTQSGDWFVIDSHDHESSEARLLSAHEPDAEPRLIAARRERVEYSVDEGGGLLYILTNAPGEDGQRAEDFRICTAPVDAPGPENWTDLVPHVPGRLILSHGVFARHLVRLERQDGLPRIVVRRLSDGQEHAIAFPEAAYSLGLGGALEFDTDTIRFSYSSMTQPAQTYDYDMETRERRLLKTQEVPSGHDPSRYRTARLMAPAEDGEMVPVSLLWRADTALDGTAPCLLYGYGAYGISIPAGFNTNALSLVDRGFVYAIAHVRGGKDKGYAWYEAGKRAGKTNTFKDFIAAARHLIAEGYTGRGRIVAQGGSAGGMLMGAIVNMAPELFAGILAEVPFVDVLATMLDDSLPLTPPEWPEWGNPIASAEDYAAIAAYSPYDNVTERAYPPILALGGLSDPRVTYWEPAKWVARLRENQRGSAPILLRTNMSAGHGGASGRFARLEEVALSYAFAIAAAGGALPGVTGTAA